MADIKAIAEELVTSTREEVNSLRQQLEQEYSISTFYGLSIVRNGMLMRATPQEEQAKILTRRSRR